MFNFRLDDKEPEQPKEDLYKKLAEFLGLKLVDTRINLYENKDGKFICTKYGFIKQTYGNRNKLHT